jgi:hypothetical protein
MRAYWLLLVLPLAGCAGSLNPLYESNKDLLDPTDYLGVWKSDGGRRMVRAALYEGQDTAQDRLVQLQLLEDSRFGRIDYRAPMPADTAALLIGGLVKIGADVYLDMTLSPAQLQGLAPELGITAIAHLVQLHSFIKISVEDKALHVQGLQVHALLQYLSKNPKAVAHKKIVQGKDGALIHLVPQWKEPANDLPPQTSPHVGPSLLLTAEPAELRQFLAQHGQEKIWADGAYFTRADEKEFEKRWHKLAARLKETQDRRKMDEIPPRPIVP